MKQPVKKPAKKAARAPAKKPVGNPTTFSQKTADEICARLIEGESLASICASKGMPKYRTVFGWLAKDPVFAQEYAHAREAQADADADAIGRITAQVLAGLIKPDAARVAIDALKWTAGKRKPNVYGDIQKIDLNATIESKDDRELLHELDQAASVLGISTAELMGTLTGKKA